PEAAVAVSALSPSSRSSAIGACTGTTWPSRTSSFHSTPAQGLGSSTVALSVMTSTSGWSRATRSPSATSHFWISPSTTDSASSGSRISLGIGSVIERLFGGEENTGHAGQIEPVLGVGVGGVETGDPEGRGEELVQDLLTDGGGDLAHHTGLPRRVRHQDHAPGPGRGPQHQVAVP